MKKLMDAYMANKKITIPVTILVAVLLVGCIAWGVSATTKDEPTVTASKGVSKITDKNGATKSTDKKDNKVASDQTDKTTSEKKDETKDTKNEDKKDTSKKENTSNKNESSNSSSSNNSANNNQQAPTEPEAPKETYDSYNRPMSCSSTFFNTYAGLPAWKENGCVCYYRNGSKVVISEAQYNQNVQYYNGGFRDCPVCGAEVAFGYISTDCNPSSENYGMDGYGCDVCRYIESRPHVHVPGCAEHGCPL